MIRLDNITLAYGNRTILREVSLHLHAGELCALVGRNGAGKSTLLRALTSHPDIVINGTPLRSLSPEKLARNIAIVNTERIRIENLRIEEVVAMGRAPYTNWIGRVQDIDREIVAAAIEQVGMTSFVGRTTTTLSDGELQRVMIARAIAQQTPIILLDEPTAFLDIPTRFELAHLLADLAHKEGKTILFSTHDIDSALPVCDTFAIIEGEHLQKLSKREASAEIERLFKR
ncbi:MAG: ABC transporter ATP-binding protein [Rikenellaceae bacterium]|nr:ABC transporter ATP-binding protein [Rikenellaceae bacterium]